MDAFFASVEQLTRPTLRGRPVLVGGLGGRGVVAGASYEARVYGARSAMPMHQARRLVGAAAVVLPPRGVVYGVASRRVLDTVRTVVPVLEQLSFDEAFGEPAELAGADRRGRRGFCAGPARQGPRRDRAGRLGRRRIGQADRQDRLRAGQARRHPGGAPRRGTRAARRAAGAPAVGDRPGRRGEAAPARHRHRRRVRRADRRRGRRHPRAATVGPALHRLARGIDDRPVAENAPAKQISAESTFPEDLTTLDQLRDATGPIGEHAHAAPRERRPRRPHRHRQAEEVRHEHADPLGDAAVRHDRRRDADRDGPPAAARPRRDRPDSPCRRGFSGLSDVRQESLFPDLEQVAEELSDTGLPPTVTEATATAPAWRVGDDVAHTEYGHGWIQGAGHGVMTVRFETRGTGPGPVHTFPDDIPDDRPRQPRRQPGLAGLRQRLGRRRSAPAGDDVARRVSPPPARPSATPAPAPAAAAAPPPRPRPPTPGPARSRR